MSSSQKFTPSGREMEGGGTFHLKTNRRVEMEFQQELNDMMKKSSMQIMAKKQAVNMLPESMAQQTARKMMPEFKAVKKRDKRKTQPMFHVDLMNEPKQGYQQIISNVPPYNPLDKLHGGVDVKPSELTKKFPYCKTKLVTTEDLTRAHITSVGVVPTARQSVEIPALRVVIEGRPASAMRDAAALAEVQSANLKEDVEPVDSTPAEHPPETIPISVESVPPRLTGISVLDEKLPKPAILGATGTTTPAVFSMRRKPPARPKSKCLRPKSTITGSSLGSYRRLPSSLYSDELTMSDSSLYGDDDDSDLDDGPQKRGVETCVSQQEVEDSDVPRQKGQSKQASSGSLRSAKQLLEEAKQITSPNVDENVGPKKPRRQSRADGKRRSIAAGGKKGDRRRSKEQESDDKSQSERTVQEIIMTLRTQSRQGALSEADRRIQEIMDRVMSRASSVLSGDQDATADVNKEPDNDYSGLHIVVDTPTRDETSIESAESDLSLPTTPLTNQLYGNTLPPKEMWRPGPRRSTLIDAQKLGILDPMKSGMLITTKSAIIETSAFADAERPAILEPIASAQLDGSPLHSPGADAEGVDPMQDDELQLLDLTNIWEDQALLPEASYEDILNVEGDAAPILDRQEPVTKTHAKTAANVYSTSVSFLSTWQPVPKQQVDDEDGIDTPWVDSAVPEKSIHHFCTVTERFQLPKQLQGVFRKYHVPSKFGAAGSLRHEFHDKLSSIPEGERSTEPDNKPGLVAPSEDEEADEGRLSAAAFRVMVDAYKQAYGDEAHSLDDWQAKADSVFNESEMVVEGCQIPLRNDESRLFWTPAPPKFDVPPIKVQQILFPTYETDDGNLTADIANAAELSSDESEVEDDTFMFDMDPEDRAIQNRILSRCWHSHTDLSKLDKAKQEREEKRRTDIETIANVSPVTGIEKTRFESPRGRVGAAPESSKERVGATTTPVFVNSEQFMSDVPSDASIEMVSQVDSHPKVGSIMAMRQHLAMETMFTPSPKQISEMSDDAIFPTFPKPRRSKSVCHLLRDDDDALVIPQDFVEVMEEIRTQRKRLKETIGIKSRPLTQETVVKQQEPTKVAVAPKPADPVETVATINKPKETMTKAQKALMSGVNYVIMTRRTLTKQRKFSTNMRIEALHKLMGQPPVLLERSQSYTKLNHFIEREFRVPGQVRRGRRSSLPGVSDFSEFSRKRGIQQTEDVREWVRQIWNNWFDEVFPPTPDHSDESSDEEPTPTVITVPNITIGHLLNKDFDPLMSASSSKKKKMDAVNVNDVETINCLDDTEENRVIREVLLEEASKLTNELESMEKPSAFILGRRGAIYRKLGMLKKASQDFERAIKMEPLLLDAYWHRHLLSLLLGNDTAAVEDLNYILRHNKKQPGAYRSRAAIFERQGDMTMAIVNYSQAIKVDPLDHVSHFKRSELYERRGDMLLALEDLHSVIRLKPSRADAILKRGIYYFTNQNWQNAITDFTNLLRADSNNADAYLYRGRANAKLAHYDNAVHDLSAAVHLDPYNWQAFYYRGTLLRKAHPKQALQDFSISLLIDDTEENLLSYLHRGILYVEIDRPSDAIPDFENLLKLDKEVACAHVYLGLIYMKSFESHYRAIKKFTSAIKVDPTYVRAYVCRGEAYHKIHDLRKALKDFTRAVHLRPDVLHYYMYRGQLVMEMGDLDLAAYCVRHASELNMHMGLGEKHTQQAIVQSFLRNYDKAIDCLSALTRTKPGAAIFVLLGKTQMKAKQYREAIETFEKALAHYKPWSRWEHWPVESGDTHYLMGLCHVEMRRYLQAHESFNSAIRIDTNHAQAYYQRGLAKMRLKQSKGIQDINKALALKPNIFQAYLSRACYYGLKKKYPKAILNCNEALKLQSNSVRAYLYRGALKYYIKAYDLAILDLSKAASIDHTCSLAYFNMAICYQDSGQYQKALMTYGIVLLLGDQLLNKVLINRGLLYFEQHDFTNALYDFKLAAKIRPFDYKIHHTLGLCYHKLNHLEDAVRAFNKCLQENAFFLDGLIGRGNVYMDYGHKAGWRQAQIDYQHTLHLDPTCLSARVNLAYTLQMLGHFMQAWTCFTTALTLNPNCKAALEGRAIVNLQMSNTFAAFQDISASMKVGITAELFTNRGVINQFMNDRVNAMRDYQSAIKLDPTYSLAYFNAANIFFHTRHFKQALSYYDQAVKYNPNDESALLNRAIAKVMVQDATGALEDFKMAIKLSPHSAHIYFNRGNLYASMKQYKSAEKDYTKCLNLQPDDPLVYKRRAEVRGKLDMKEEAILDYKLAIDLKSQQTG